ncbi:MAG: sigma-70 family RNA polymerase sigma factor [Clostridia bacterium]|nr:sigma-70 family RNA polymerase sigma factor [Clostridia bacterium]
MSTAQKQRTEQRTLLITQNVGLVHSAAHRFSGRGIDYDDLFQAGCVGLIKAADGFDETLGLKFSTYAVPAIFGEIKRLFRDGGSVKIGRSVKQLAMRAVRAREQFVMQNGSEPSVSELAELLGVSREEAAEAVLAASPTVSLTVTDRDDEENQLDIPVDFPEAGITDRLALTQALSELEDGDRRLLSMRYFQHLPQARVAQTLGMTQVQVSRREKKILELIRRKLSG